LNRNAGYASTRTTWHLLPTQRSYMSCLLEKFQPREKRSTHRNPAVCLFSLRHLRYFHVLKSAFIVYTAFRRFPVQISPVLLSVLTDILAVLLITSNRMNRYYLKIGHDSLQNPYLPIIHDSFAYRSTFICLYL